MRIPVIPITDSTVSDHQSERSEAGAEGSSIDAPGMETIRAFSGGKG